MAAEAQTLESSYEPVAGVPLRAVNTYTRLWQLETWLRILVYVELRALLGNSWADGLGLNPKSFEADKSLTHMPTPAMNALSYAQLSDLLKIIEKHWDCFAPYLPPQHLWKAKIEEVRQVRNRVAHFRAGHEDDLPRLKQLLRDLDKGFWRFCTSYNNCSPLLPAKNDPVATHFLPLDPLPWKEFEAGRWAQIGIRDQSLPIGVKVRSQRRPWASAFLEPGKPGHFYDFYVFAQNGRELDLQALLERTELLHDHFVHIVLEDDRSVRLTVPAVLDVEAVTNAVSTMHEAALNSLRQGFNRPSVEAVAERWPEHVIGPTHPLSFLGPDMPCSFFGV